MQCIRGTVQLSRRTLRKMARARMMVKPKNPMPRRSPGAAHMLNGYAWMVYLDDRRI